MNKLHYKNLKEVLTRQKLVVRTKEAYQMNQKKW